MNILEQHEIFEMEVLDCLKRSRLLESLIFGGGTMLRLCHELPRYSAVLDFWKLKFSDDRELMEKLVRIFENDYEITDSQIKHFTVLMELRSGRFPKRLKIEIRRELKDWDYEEKIAFSRFSNKQVLLKAHTLQQTLNNKIEALMQRGEIRDAFDIELLLRKGMSLPSLSKEQIETLRKKLKKFKQNDFKVTLGSVLESDWRQYYVNNGFKLLEEKLTDMIRG